MTDNIQQLRQRAREVQRKEDLYRRSGALTSQAQQQLAKERAAIREDANRQTREPQAAPAPQPKQTRQEREYQAALSKLEDIERQQRELQAEYSEAARIRAETGNDGPYNRVEAKDQELQSQRQRLLNDIPDLNRKSKASKGIPYRKLSDRDPERVAQLKENAQEARKVEQALDRQQAAADKKAQIAFIAANTNIPQSQLRKKSASDLKQIEQGLQTGKTAEAINKRLKGQKLTNKDLLLRERPTPLTSENVKSIQSITSLEANDRQRGAAPRVVSDNRSDLGIPAVSERQTSGRIEPGRDLSLLDTALVWIRNTQETAAKEAQRTGSLRAKITEYALAVPAATSNAVLFAESVVDISPQARDRRSQTLRLIATGAARNIQEEGVVGGTVETIRGPAQAFRASAEANPALLLGDILLTKSPEIFSFAKSSAQNVITRLDPRYRPTKVDAFGVERIDDIKGVKGTVNIDLVPEGSKPVLSSDANLALRQYGDDIPRVTNPQIPTIRNPAQRRVLQLAKERGDVQTGSFAQKVLVKDSRDFADLDTLTPDPKGFIDDFQKTPEAKGTTVEKVTIPGDRPFDIYRIKDSKTGEVLADIDPIGRAEEGFASKYPYIEVDGIKFIDPRVRLAAKTQQLNKPLTAAKREKVTTDIQQLTDSRVNLKGQAVRGAYGVSREKALSYAGKTGDLASAQRGLFGFFEKEKTVGKPADVPIESSLFASPFDAVTGRAQLRKTRLGVIDKDDASFADLLSGDATLGSGKPQALIFEQSKIADIPKDIYNDGNLNLAKYRDFQLEKTGEFKAGGYLGGEAEVTLAPGEIIRKEGLIGKTIIEGKTVPIYSVSVVKPSEATRKLIDKANANTITAAEKNTLYAELAKETGFSPDEIRVLSSDQRPTYKPDLVPIPLTKSAKKGSSDDSTATRAKTIYSVPSTPNKRSDPIPLLTSESKKTPRRSSPSTSGPRSSIIPSSTPQKTTSSSRSPRRSRSSLWSGLSRPTRSTSPVVPPPTRPPQTTPRAIPDKDEDDKKTFNIFVRRFGQLQKVGTASSVREAKQTLFSEIGRTLAASGKITEGGNAVNIGPRKGFRRSKADASFIVEKKERRLKKRGSSDEVSEIFKLKRRKTRRSVL